jgi:hypothetical protein
MLHENSKELDTHTMYHMEGGLAHGRVPIADSAEYKENIIVVAKSNKLRPTKTASYRTAVDENEQLKKINEDLREMNRDLKQNNDQLKEKYEILTEKNSVNHEMIMVIFVSSLIAMY